MPKYDIAIIGGGPAGYVAAIYAAGHGKKVALIEKDHVGGACLNRGCIPTKTLIASLASGDLSFMMQRKNQVVTKLRAGVENLLKAKGVVFVKGAGRLIDKGVIEVGSERIESKSVIIATGSRPSEIPRGPRE